MALRPDTVKAGDVIYSVRREKAGNTTMSRDRIDEYRIADVRTRVVTPAYGKPYTVTEWVTAGGKALSYGQVQKMRRSPPEWFQGVSLERRCYFCRGKKSDGHEPDCTHPAAVKARKVKP